VFAAKWRKTGEIVAVKIVLLGLLDFCMKISILKRKKRLIDSGRGFDWPS
jgi:hypothetical protein